MPRGDRTGPNSEGPMTGRRMGYCAGNDRPGYTESNQYFGRGGGGFRRRGGRGFGGGFGFRGENFNSDFTTNVSEKTLLENEIRILKDQLSSLEKKLSESGDR
ncbi:MAG: DUF5320 domain-containing protein [Candidatus Delongbacteria bacterium]|nr:DUF5320 domain-containing protein [Candidatus Delongbacteria bacterium]